MGSDGGNHMTATGFSEPGGKPQLSYCKCDSCKGEIDYDYNDMLDPEGASISRYCADMEWLEVLYWKKLISDTNAEYDLSVYGPEEFCRRNYNANLDPVEKDLFEEMKILKPTQ